MKRVPIFWFCLIAALFTGTALIGESIEIASWDEDTPFNGKRSVRFSPGDDARFSDPKFDDSRWRAIALPISRDDLPLLGNDETEISWYRIAIRIPEGLPRKSIGVSLGKIADIDEAWWNGERIGSSGDFGTPEKHASNKVRMYEIPTVLLKPGEDNVLAIRVRNTWRADELPGRGNFYFGPMERMRDRFYVSGMRELAFAVVYLIFFAYFLLLFAKRAKQTENLYYGLFSLSFSIYSFCRADIKYEFVENFMILQKVEFCSMYFAIPILMAFIMTYYGRKHRWYHHAYYIFSALCILAVALMRDHMQWYNLNVRVVQYTWVFPFAVMFRTLVANARKSPDARIMLGTMLIVCFGMVHDIMLSRGIGILPSVDFWITPFAMFIFVGGIATILSVRFANFLTQIEELNETLERKVTERTAELDKSLREISARDAKIRQELAMAGTVQQSLLPESLPDWPVRTAVRFKPLREVSGDFYHLIKTQDGGYMMVIGDVSGHGMPAALYAIISMKAFLAGAHGANSPCEVLSAVNDELCKLNTGHYLTSFVVKYDGRGTLHFANAGHPRAFLMSRKQKKIIRLDTEGTVIGIRDDARSIIRDAQVPFEQGDRVFLYTDCLIEHTNVSGEQFGDTRLIDTLKKHFFDDLDSLIDHTMEDFAAFTMGAENKDDLTILAMEIPIMD